MKFTSVTDVLNYLDRIPMFKDRGLQAANFSLVSIRRFCELAGHPERNFRSVHVAGTNGKGTVCHMLASCLTEAGFKTGLFTSPHLIRYQERYRINGFEIEDHHLMEFFNRYHTEIESCKLSYFEISAALAFWYFSVEKVDIAIIETGLGGRLDATNVIQPLVSVITSIGLDHTDILGPDLASIAREKAGIIKENTPVVTGKIPDVALAEILATAEEKNAAYHSAMTLAPRWSNEKVELTHPETGQIQQISLQLLNPVHAINTAITAVTLNSIRDLFPVSDAHFKSGIFKTGSKTGLFARFERLTEECDWFYDGAHNPEAFAYTLKTARLLANGRPKILVLNLMKDKISPEMTELVSQFDELYYFETNNNRAARYEEVSLMLPELNRFHADDWLTQFKSALVIFSGSLYFYQHIHSLIQNYGSKNSATSP